MTHDNNTNYYKFWKDCVEFKAMLVVLCVCVCVWPTIEQSKRSKTIN